ncbi:MAG: UDP-N-acetylmuramate dehydrogenase [Gammaproteobacteria bacterium]|nr:UDP-N-acetylmuramate dehydrogenase [Gammaproteobacteria bacterium]
MTASPPTSGLLNESLAPYTSWRVGGVADRLYLPDCQQALLDFIRQLHKEEPLLWMGRGSNLLVRDGGVRGTVIVLSKGVDRVEWRDDETLYAESGASLARLSRVARSQGWGGLDFLAGIPGSVGGALAMNAGAFGGEIWQQVKGVEAVSRDGALHYLEREAFEVGYRRVKRLGSGDPIGFLSATFHRAESIPDQGSNPLQQQLKQRNRSQPMGEYSCGSVFRNPPGEFAGRLIEKAGLKGVAVGAASVSVQHANFIVHQGGATAREIESLIEHVATVVEQRFGVRLQCEVKIVGEVERRVS